MYSVVKGAGLHPNAGPDLVRILKEAGFINVNTVTFDMPIKHSGKIGDLFWYVFLDDKQYLFLLTHAIGKICRWVVMLP